ncbi:hypothetical protein N798_13855 [Knoellia flava TL1]|uniref:Hemerythrin-like domain-containing protein n=2 Tax=Knoellia flava TaxID=913969 RepID=A0A8H9FRR8_9MICO|nr:hypothetical protein [Knoellia flava]KGN29628.1 hypothetical protein N798_13855 [Knoellia flava TL1]GGB75054.1 hypothetical protein GCM10011314_13200 [Knoellia flava]
MDPEFAAYLDRVRAHRAELGESMAALDAALALPIGLGPLWRRRVRAALTELEHDLRDHRAITEEPGGLYAGAVARAPRLASLAKLQMEDHLDFIEVVQRLLGERDEGLRSPDAVAAHREAATELVGRIIRHRQRGADLIYEAYEVDIGGQG